MNLKKYSIPAFILGLILIVGSCEDLKTLIVDCDECFDYEPDTADLIIYVTLNNENPEIPIVLYRGNVEEGKVDWVDTIREATFYLPSAVDQFYSITAEYKVGDKTIVVVDGDEMKARNEDETCGAPCWIIRGGYLKVELEFDE